MKCTTEEEKHYFANRTEYVTGHDWVLAPHVPGLKMGEDGRAMVPSSDNSDKLLWACPCGEFKWTSYAEWERGSEIAEVAKERQ